MRQLRPTNTIPMLILSLFAGWVSPLHSQTKTVVTFPTEDDVTIYGTLHLPQTSRPQTPGIILLAEPEWIIRATLDITNLGPELVKKYGFVVLTMDFRGNGKSSTGKLFRTFSRRDLEKLQLDVRAAIKYLSSQKTVDPHRVGIVGVGIGGNYALLEADEQPAVQAVVLISSTLSNAAKEYIKTRSDVPILCLEGKDDREGIREMAEAFSLSQNKYSNIILADSGHGTGMFSRMKGLSEQVTQWLAENVTGTGTETEISFNSEDGWSLHGRLRMPETASESSKVPGVVLVHGANHDQDTYYDLSKSLAKKGIAALTYDWRGKNRDVSEKRGHYGVNMQREDSQNSYLDTKAAINFLAAQKGVDANRIGLIGATAGSQDTFKAPLGDTRVKTIVILTEENVSDAVKKYLATMDVPVFFVASTEDVNYDRGNLSDLTKQAYLLSKNKYSQFLLYDDAGRGSEMMKTKPELEGMIVRWFADKLAQ